MSPPAAEKYSPGNVIASKYRLTSVLGEGGMGSVWLARNLTLDVDMAVKLMRREKATAEAAQRLLQEARAAARLVHPSIVRVFDFGETEHGDPYIVMELLKGESLAEVLDQKGRLPAANAVQMLLPVVSALSAAHLQGIVHRDLKPDNIVLVTDETGAIIPKLVDFGIAKLTRDDVDERMTTQAGTVLGSPDYMSPEQARGRTDIDERTDVWALSVVLYEALTGRRPFDGANYNALLSAIIEESPTPTTEFGAGDDALWSILERGLAKNTVERWSTMQAFGRALGAWAIERGYDTDVAGTSIRQHWLEQAGRRPLADQPPPSESARLLVSRKSVFGSGPPRALELVIEDTPDEVEDELAASIAAQIDRETQPPALPVVPVELGLAEAPAPARAPEAPRTHTGAAAVWSPPQRKRTSQAPTLTLLAVVLVGASAFVGREPLLRLISRPAVATPPRVPPTPAATPPAAPPTHAEAPPVVPLVATDAGNVRATEIDRCAASLFAEGTYDSGHAPSFASICSETDPRRGATAMKTELVRASGGKKVTDGMREWSLLGWYEMAAFEVARATCCAAPAPIVVPAPAGTCPPIAETLTRLGSAAATAGDVDQALSAYTKAIHCAVSSGAAAPYGYEGHPQGGEEEALRRMLGRIRAAPRGAAAPSASSSATAATKGTSKPTATSSPRPAAPTDSSR